MKYSLLLALLFFHLNSHAQKIKKPNRLDPKGTVRLTNLEYLYSNNYIVFGIGREVRYPIGFKILETDSATIQLYLEAGSGGGGLDIKKGSLVKIYFTDSSMITLTAVKDVPSTGVRDVPNSRGISIQYAHGYYELSKEVQQLFISKEVESLRVEHLYYKIDKKKGGLIGKALELFN